MKKFIYIVPFVFTPISTFAAFDSFKDYLDDFDYMIDILIFLAGATALLLFFWGLAKFIGKAGDPKSHEEGRGLMIWGAIALFVIVSIGGIIVFIQDNLDIGDDPINFDAILG